MPQHTTRGLLLFASFAGLFVDRWSRKKTVIVSPLFSAVFVALLVFVHPAALPSAAEYLERQFGWRRYGIEAAQLGTRRRR